MTLTIEYQRPDTGTCQSQIQPEIGGIRSNVTGWQQCNDHNREEKQNIAGQPRLAHSFALLEVRSRWDLWNSGDRIPMLQQPANLPLLRVDHLFRRPAILR